MARRNGFLSAESGGDSGGPWSAKEIAFAIFMGIMLVLWVFTIPTGESEQ